jgi:alanine racemase
MGQHRANLNEEWQRFLQQNPEARLVVDSLMHRTGLTDDEVLILLLEAWIERNCIGSSETGSLPV